MGNQSGTNNQKLIDFLFKLDKQGSSPINEGFVLDKEALEVLRAKIMAKLIDDLPIMENKSKRK
jgi:hypothetical protein